MGTKYSTTAVASYNATPPADDASQTAANQIFWSTIKTKLSDPLNTWAAAVDTKLVATLDTSARLVTTSGATVAGDHNRSIEIGVTVTTGLTISLGDATTMAAGYMVTITNQSSVAQTIGRVTSANTINGTAGNFALSAFASATFKVNQSVTGYMVEAASPQFKAGSFTRDQTVASGTQAVTGVGFQPRAVIFLAGQTGTTKMSVGADDGIGPAVLFQNIPAIADGFNADAGSRSIVLTDTAAVSYAGTVTAFAADGFTVTWVRTGAPTGTATINYLALR